MPTNPPLHETVYFNRGENFIPNPDATAIHGITREIMLSGVDPYMYYTYKFLPLVKDCDLIVSHNIRFDKSVII